MTADGPFLSNEECKQEEEYSQDILAPSIAIVNAEVENMNSSTTSLMKIAHGASSRTMTGTLFWNVYPNKCIFCHKDSFDSNNKKKVKKFMSKKKCSFAAKCKFCSRHSCFFCIDSILNKFKVQSRSDHWYKHFNALRQDYHWLKVQGHTKGILETDFCHACEFRRRLNVLIPSACYENEENVKLWKFDQ